MLSLNNLVVSLSFTLSLVPSLLKLQEDTLFFVLFCFFFATNNKKKKSVEMHKLLTFWEGWMHLGYLITWKDALLPDSQMGFACRLSYFWFMGNLSMEFRALVLKMMFSWIVGVWFLILRALLLLSCPKLGEYCATCCAQKWYGKWLGE